MLIALLGISLYRRSLNWGSTVVVHPGELFTSLPIWHWIGSLLCPNLIFMLNLNISRVSGVPRVGGICGSGPNFSKTGLLVLLLD